MIDTRALRDRIDLRDLIGQDVALKRASASESHGPCPWCGGRDRLLVTRNIWTCRRCIGTDKGEWRDAIAYVQMRYRLGFHAACDWLAKWSGMGPVLRVGTTPPHRRPYTETDTSQPPSLSWQASGWRVVEDCEGILWSDAGTRARLWLHRRGLRDDTLKAWAIGFADALAPGTGRKMHGLWVWHGITIPWSDGHSLWGIKVRRSTGDRYRMVPGSRQKGALFGVHRLSGKRDCIIVEGEFDAMLLWQEVGDVADVLTLGSAGGHLSERWIPALIAFERFWIATDDDEAGWAHARYWEKLAGNRGRRVLPEGKDVTEAWQAGRDPRAWAMTFIGN